MPTYTVKAPDGKTVTLQGPAGASQAEIIAQAQRLYKPTAAPKPVSRQERQSAKFAALPQSEAQRVLKVAEEAFLRPFAGKSESVRMKALERFRATPQLQVLRQSAGLAPVSTREQDVKAVARQNIDARRKQRQQAGIRISPQEEAMGAGSANFLGLGPLASAGTDFIGDVLSGRPTEFKRDLDVARTENRILRDQGPAQAFAGEVISGFGGGGLAAKGLQAGVRVLAPVAPRVSQAIRSATTLQRGQKAKNVARIAGAGAAGGAAQSAGEGSDISTGAAYGAGGALALGGGVKALGWLGGKASDLFRVTGADALLRRYTSIGSDELAKRLADFRKRGKGEPTIYELLPLEDRQKFRDVSKRMPGGPRERAAELARARVQAIPGEVAETVQQATKADRRATVRTLATDLATSRGAPKPTLSEAKLATAAVSNPTKLGKLARDEAENIMKPFDTRVAYESTSDLVPQVPVTNKKGTVVFKEDEAQKDVANMIRNATTALRFSKDITVSDLTRVLRHLDDRAAKGDIDTDIARAAANHIEDLIRRDHPDALDAVEKMKAAWAGKMRMQEGVKELRLQQEVPAKTRKQQLLSENVYETPEGGAGRGIGQRLRLTEDLGQETQKSLGTVRELAGGTLPGSTTGRTLEQNLGRSAAGEITEAAQVQGESARKLATALVEQPSNIGEIEAGDLALLASALNPASMAYTKFRAIADISRFIRGIPENRARTMVDMLFSRDPAMTQRAINALRAAGDEGSQALRGLTQAIAAGVLSAPGSADATEAGPDSPSVEVPEDMAEDIPVEEESADPGESPYEQELQDLYELEDPELLDLIDRVEQQESGGDQSAVSSAGAIGVMQVMPDTAPEAAELAGLPWDEEAYYSDPTYNKLLGIAYLSEMLRRYDGDVNLALAAYNAGPGRADEYAAGRGNLPAETRDYISKIAG